MAKRSLYMFWSPQHRIEMLLTRYPDTLLLPREDHTRDAYVCTPASRSVNVVLGAVSEEVT